MGREVNSNQTAILSPGRLHIVTPNADNSHQVRHVRPRTAVCPQTHSFPRTGVNSANPRGVRWRGRLPASAPGRAIHFSPSGSGLKSAVMSPPPPINASALPCPKDGFGKWVQGSWGLSASCRRPQTGRCPWTCLLCSLLFFSIVCFPAQSSPHPSPNPFSPPKPGASGFPQDQWLFGAEVREGTAFPILFVLVQWPGLISLS